MSLHVLYSFPTRLGTPGIGMTAWHQVTGLAALGVKTTLFCGSCEKPVPGVHRVVETMRLGPLSVPYRLLGLDRAMHWHDRKVAGALSRLRADVDLVHCWPSGALRTLKVGKELGTRTVLERPSSHTAQVYEVTEQESRKLGMAVRDGHYASAANAARLVWEEAEFRAAQYLLCPSDFAADTFIARGFSRERMKLHQYGYDQARFSRGGDRRSQGDDRPFSVIFAGECFPLKGLHMALDAWFASGAAEKGKFYICGRFHADYRQVLHERLRHPSIVETGFVSDVAAVMRNCDALVLPSLSEGSALVTYEARACGLVLLVSSSAGARCTHGYDAMVHTAGDAAALRAHMAQLTEDKILLNRLRTNSLAGLHELTWERAAERLVEIYGEIIGKQNKSAAAEQLNEPLEIAKNDAQPSKACRTIPNGV